MDGLIHLTDVRVLLGQHVLVHAPAWQVRAGDRWALVGRNGSGKSTLLDVLRGWRDPTEGTCRIRPGLDVTFVAQQRDVATPRGTLTDLIDASVTRLHAAEVHVRNVERRLAAGTATLAEVAEANEAFERAGGYGARLEIERAVRRILPAVAFDTPVAEIDPALRHRAALAIALARPGDVVILDEPSNGLDVTARAWLQDRIARLPQHVTLVLASHDRTLLAHASRQTAWIEDAMLHVRRFGFDAVQEQRGVVRLDAKARRPRPSSTERRSGPGRPILRARNLAVKDRFGEVGFDLPEGETWVLLGSNGMGASSLLDLLAARRRADRPDAEVWLRPGARVFHADVTTRGLSNRPLREQIEAWVHAPRAASLLALAGLPPDRWSALPDTLSGGERARASLALMLASEPDVLLLDEPERDLDLTGLTLLEQVLRDARSAALVVTHDLRLAQAVAERTASLREGRFVAWRGGVEGWRVGRKRREEDLPTLLPITETNAPAQASVESLEDAFLEVEAMLSDPTRLGERDRVRLEARRTHLIEARMMAYDARLPRPAPRFRSVEPPLVLEADVEGATVTLHGADWPTLPRVVVVAGVAHVSLPDPEGSAWSSWARRAALRAVLGLAFPALGVAWVQTPAVAGGEPFAPFERFDDAWWVVSQDAWWTWARPAPNRVARVTPVDRQVVPW